MTKTYLSLFLGLLLAVLTLSPASAQTFGNPNPILIPGIGTTGVGTPYPSNITVEGLTGGITTVTVSLYSLSHGFPADIDLLLVGPTGVTVLLMSDVGGGGDVLNVDLRFMDGGPMLTGAQIVSGTYSPSNIGTGDLLAAPAPAAPYGTTLAGFNGTNPNGVWSLYAVDDAGGDSGQIAGGYSLTFSVVSPLTVTNLEDHNDGQCTADDCTLVEALIASNATPGWETINFAPALTGVIPNTSVSTGLRITNTVTINGPGAGVLSISGNNSARVFDIAAGVQVNISGLSLINGKAGGNAFPGNVGGAILNHASLTLTDCTLSGNSATSNGGCIYNNGSGGNAFLTLLRCTLNGNSTPASGGALLNAGYNGVATLTLTNCTLHQNQAGQYGGTIYNDGTSSGNASLTLTNCTLNQNTAAILAGGIYNDALNPGSSGVANLRLQNTILRAGVSGANLVNDSGNITSGGHNLSSDAAGGPAGTAPGGFLNATGDTRNTDPQLDPAGLASNGGPTDTVALLSGSLAINAGNDANAPSKDQRGYFRSGISDIGAFEFNGAAPPTRFETESLAVRTISGAQHIVINDAKLSGGAGTALVNTVTGSFVAYYASVPAAGTYDVKVRIKTGPQRGKFQLAIGGVNRGPVQDEYSSQVKYQLRNLGQVTFASGGNKTFRFTIAGKNANSAGTTLAFDAIDLIPQ